MRRFGNVFCGLMAIVAMAASTLAAFADPLATGEMPTEKVRKHLGKGVADVLLRAERIEAYRLGNLDPAKAGADDTVGGRLVIGPPKAVPRETAVRLVKTLLAEDTYFKADSKGTKTAVGYRLWTDRKECLELSCCLVKGNIWMVLKDPAGKVLAKGDLRGFRDDRQSPMRLLALELFPDDPEVQATAPKKLAK